MGPAQRPSLDETFHVFEMKKSPKDSVADLERRLQALGAPRRMPVAPKEENKAERPPEAAPPVKKPSGKNLLLVRLLSRMNPPNRCCLE